MSILGPARGRGEAAEKKRNNKNETEIRKHKYARTQRALISAMRGREGCESCEGRVKCGVGRAGLLAQFGEVGFAERNFDVVVAACDRETNANAHARASSSTRAHPSVGERTD
jgi:hypothetical protein